VKLHMPLTFINLEGAELYSDTIVDQARKNLKLRKNSREYKNLIVQITGDPREANKSYEVFAYAIETHMSGMKNKFADEIFRLVME
jgi:hypothetical protein